ncbi:efflux transporter outer membrane subunit [Aureibacter tunicatorum]|uniref:Multidrug efflux system outer membrane protein n=1 Tax=Aureibacter tunicatorum TaxID=866807 RepID=A0AAE3XP93_9BACT|nr:efflux transporter outer membrane subunit [Aureibacter tunicatorum]MDR6240198.1 multidrug efflux system outer membrane protein [Aureibacter tunicatorum]BDD05921.1 membrane protein [Aureibacter tunicatorum]
MKHCKYLIYFILFGFTLLGCKIGRNYQRPEMPIPATWDNETDSLSNLADMAWWELYQDTVLQELINQALVQNQSALIAMARIEEAAGLRRVAASPLFPQIGAKLTYETEGEVNSEGKTKTTDTYEGYATVLWELDIWGKYRRANEAARAELLSTSENYKAVIISLVSNVAQAYFELLDLDNRIEITQGTIVARKEAERIAKLRFEGGLSNEVGLIQAQLELARTEAVLPKLQEQLVFKRNEISILLGVPPQEIPRGESLNSQNIPVSPIVPAGIPSELINRRPDVASSEQLLIAANASVGVAQGNMLPSLALSTGDIGLSSNSIDKFLQATYWDFLAGLTAPIFNGGRLKGNLVAAKARHEQALQGYKQVVLLAFEDVSNSLVRHYKAIEIRQAQEKVNESSAAYLQIANIQYFNGYINYLDVLDAQRRQFDAELELSISVRDELISSVLLYKSLGGGWNPVEPEQSEQ